VLEGGIPVPEYLSQSKLKQVVVKRGKFCLPYVFCE